jgi:hypothetical protein
LRRHHQALALANLQPLRQTHEPPRCARIRAAPGMLLA